MVYFSCRPPAAGHRPPATGPHRPRATSLRPPDPTGHGPMPAEQWKIISTLPALFIAASSLNRNFKTPRVRASLLANACLPIFQLRNRNCEAKRCFRTFFMWCLQHLCHCGRIFGQSIFAAEFRWLQHTKPFTSARHEGQLVGQGLLSLELSLHCPVKHTEPFTSASHDGQLTAAGTFCSLTNFSFGHDGQLVGQTVASPQLSHVDQRMLSLLLPDLFW